MINFEGMSSKNAIQFHKIACLFLTLTVISCGTVKKKTTYSSTSKQRTVTVAPSTNKVDQPQIRSERKRVHLSVADNIINTALTFSGTKYKYGGTTKKGMDCSGLLYVSFGEHDVQLPRVSYHMAEKGKRIKINKVAKGDLLFFKTRKRSRRINHVGMVVAVDNNEVRFIHASSSRGVIVSSLREGYWNSAFVKATRVL